MSSWDELGRRIRQDYPIAEESDDLFVLVFRLSATFPDRTQVVRISKEPSMNGEEWAHVTSPVGRLNEIDIKALLQESGETGRGGLATIGDTGGGPSFDTSAQLRT